MSQRHTDERREGIKKRLARGESIHALRVETGIPERTLRDWKRELECAAKSESPEGKSMGSTVLAIPDMHHPFAHPDALAFLKAVKARFKPTQIVILGDEVDFHSFSRYLPDPDGMSPGHELARAIEGLVPFYLEFPDALVCESNHTVRPLKKMWEAGLPAAFLPTYAKMLNAPDGWRWNQTWQIDGVRYHHGDAGRSGQFASAQYIKLFKQSHVHGHLHGHACCVYEGPYFGINAGCLIDPAAYAFKYARNNPVPVSLGCAIIMRGRQGHFIPMLTDDAGRWIGSLS